MAGSSSGQLATTESVEESSRSLRPRADRERVIWEILTLWDRHLAWNPAGSDDGLVAGTAAKRVKMCRRDAISQLCTVTRVTDGIPILLGALFRTFLHHVARDQLESRRERRVMD